MYILPFPTSVCWRKREKCRLKNRPRGSHISLFWHVPHAEGGLSLLVYIIESVCLFVRSKRQTTAQIDAKRSGITKNDPESVLCVLKLPVLVFLRRYRDISGFSFAADRHFYLSHFHFRILRRRLTQSAFVKRRRPCTTSVLFHR